MTSFAPSFMDTTPDSHSGHPFLLSAPPPHLQMHHQQQQHMTIPVTISENPWEDWSSIASSTTLLDDSSAAAFLTTDAVQWPGSPAPGTGAA